MELFIGLLVAAGSMGVLPQAIAPVAEQAGKTIGLDMQIALIAGGASLLGALLGALIPTTFTYFQSKRSRDDECDFLAVQVSSALYTYASGCVDVAYDTGESDDQGRQCIAVASPAFDPLSLDVNWRSISVGLLDRIFALPSAQRIVSGRLSWEAENDFEYPILDRQVEYARLAIKALTIAQDLRRVAKLPPDPDGVIDLLSQMSEYLPGLEQRQAQIEQWQKESISQLVAR